MAQASSSTDAGLYGNVTFGPRDGGNSWLVVAIVAAAVVIGLLVWRKGSK